MDLGARRDLLVQPGRWYRLDLLHPWALQAPAARWYLLVLGGLNHPWGLAGQQPQSPLWVLEVHQAPVGQPGQRHP